MTVLDKRLRCHHCRVFTWMTDHKAFMSDHARPDGKTCQKAKNGTCALEKKPHPWSPDCEDWASGGRP